MLAALLALPGCSGVQSALGVVEDTAASVLLPIDQELALGVQLRAELASELTVHADPELQAYIQALGQQVVAAATDRDPRVVFTFTVVDDPATVNAFAIPGGHIYMYTGLMRAAENEAEIMAVLSHEVAHVTKRHVAERLVAAYGIDAVTQMALGRSPGMVSQLVAEVAATGVLLRYSRAAETESDEVGFEYLVRTGYSPTGFVTFFAKLEGGNQPPQFMSTHPDPSNRVAAARARIAARSNLPTRTTSPAFDAMRARL